MLRSNYIQWHRTLFHCIPNCIGKFIFGIISIFYFLSVLFFMFCLILDECQRSDLRFWFLYRICFRYIGANISAMLFWQRFGFERRRIRQCHLSFQLDRAERDDQEEYDFLHGIFEKSTIAESRQLFSDNKRDLCFGAYFFC